MIQPQRIQRYVSELVREFHPERVILFGSHASGMTHVDSDVDLLVVMPHTGPAAKQAVRIRRRISAGFPVDLIVRSPRTIERRIRLGDSFLSNVLAHGKVLHEARRP